MRTLIVLILAVALAGCAGMSREEQGAVGGAALGIIVGVLAGNALDCQGCAAIGGAVGGIAGGAGGAAWGRELDRLDRQNLSRTFESTPDHQAAHWRNPNNGAKHRAVVTKTYSEGGRPCREFHDDVVIGGKRQQIYGKACRTGPNSWELVQ